MSDKYFVDTNILVYFRDASEPDKQQQSREWLDRLWRTRTGALSLQVLSEYYVTVTQKLRPGLSRKEAWRDVQALFAWSPIGQDVSSFQIAKDVQTRFEFSWWDALIVSAAKKAGCRYLLTEDLQHGQDLDGLYVTSPFEASPQVE